MSVETALRVAPYIGGSEGGCTSTPRHATEVYVVGETVQTVVIALHKGESYEILPTENITLATAMAGSGISSATWTSAVRYSSRRRCLHGCSFSDAMALYLSGLNRCACGQWLHRNASPSAVKPYQAHLDLSIASQSNVTLSVPIFLSVSASTIAAAWGTASENGRCTEAVGAVTSMTHSLDDQIDLHFVACDVEMLPVQHRLPSASDPREFSVMVRHASGEALEGTDYRLTMDATSPGKYVVQLTLLHLAEYTVQLVLADKPVAKPLSITTKCPTGRVPIDLSCGCAQGTIYNDDTMVCEACPPNTFNNKTMHTDEQLACKLIA